MSAPYKIFVVNLGTELHFLKVQFGPKQIWIFSKSAIWSPNSHLMDIMIHNSLTCHIIGHLSSSELHVGWRINNSCRSHQRVFCTHDFTVPEDIFGDICEGRVFSHLRLKIWYKNTMKTNIWEFFSLSTWLSNENGLISSWGKNVKFIPYGLYLLN